ncbi:MAG: hypothetical protein Q7K71_03670 [Candidatus Omnitrophota bacterium]|nr:hypothetical protein [Candidatus Omnitrophota bacterium]
MDNMFESPLFWPAHIKGNTLYVLDETLLPLKTKYIPVRNVKGAVAVIRDMKTRAFGQFLVVLNTFLLEAKGQKSKVKDIEAIALALNNSRPTFPFAEVTGIVTGVARKAAHENADVCKAVVRTVEGFLESIRHRRLERVRRIAAHMADGDPILTHCNVSGELAMAAFLALKEGRRVKFYATETRPYMQGAKLTAWELQKAGAHVTVVPDNTVGALMAEGLVNKIIIGSDRSAANGDVANKVGSYQIAVLAKEFGIPLIVLTQPSKGVATGHDMPIEMRDADELLVFNNKKVFGPKARGFYPGFDVVPNTYITEAIAIHAGL